MKTGMIEIQPIGVQEISKRLLHTALVGLLAVGAMVDFSQASEPLFSEPLVLVEVVSQEDFTGQQDPNRPFYRGALSHNVRLRVVEVFDGPETLVGVEIPLLAPYLWENDPPAEDAWVTNESWRRPVAPKVEIGTQMVIHVMRYKDHDRERFNPYRFPFASIFFHEQISSSRSNKHTEVEPYMTRLAWAQMVREVAQTLDVDERLKLLVGHLSSPNPMISSSAVHLMAEFYPDKAIPFFEKAVFDPRIAFVGRLAMNHELCLAKGQEWGDDNNEKIEESLKQAPDFDQSKLGARIVGLRTNAWFDRERRGL